MGTRRQCCYCAARVYRAPYGKKPAKCQKCIDRKSRVKSKGLAAVELQALDLSVLVRIVGDVWRELKFKNAD